MVDMSRNVDPCIYTQHDVSSMLVLCCIWDTFEN